MATGPIRPRLCGVHLWQAIVGALGIALVLVSAEVIRVGFAGQPFAIDVLWHNLLALHRSAWFLTPSLALNLLGGTAAMTVITIAVMANLALSRQFFAAAFVGLTVLASAGLSTVAKQIGDRPRPGDSIVVATSGAFPSGHTTATAALLVALALTYLSGQSPSGQSPSGQSARGRNSRRAVIWTLASLGVAAMAFSRTYLFAHWLTDTIGGAILGGSVALLLWAPVAERIASQLRKLRRAGP
jgi:membrane-associated phospholipid phosphatase